MMCTIFLPACFWCKKPAMPDEVLIPIYKRPEPPKEFLTPIEPPKAKFVFPFDERAVLALTDEGQKEWMGFLLDLQKRIETWECWAKYKEVKDAEENCGLLSE